MIRRRRDPYKLRRLRQFVQLVFLLALTLLLVIALFGRLPESRIPLLGVTLIAIVLTLVLGRVWCGWVCPLGTVLTWTRFRGAMERGVHVPDRLRMVKYVLLALILAVALLGILRPLPGWMDRNAVAGGIAIIVLVVASVGLNFFADLFWCRYLCPLGGAVALLSKIAPMRRIVRLHCNDCSVCVDACPMGAVDPRRGFVNDPGSARSVSTA